MQKELQHAHISRLRRFFIITSISSMYCETLRVGYLLHCMPTGMWVSGEDSHGVWVCSASYSCVLCIVVTHVIYFYSECATVWLSLRCVCDMILVTGVISCYTTCSSTLRVISTKYRQQSNPADGFSSGVLCTAIKSLR